MHKKPKVYDLAELTPYKKILEISNVHKKSNGELKTHPTSSKFREIISVLFELQTAVKTPTPRTPTSFQDSALKYFSPRLNKKSTPNSSFKKSFGKGLIPRYKIARQNSYRMDYVYWDDPNELVDRLRLLMAEQAAGNMSHTNEIHAIIEELREAGYIY